MSRLSTAAVPVSEPCAPFASLFIQNSFVGDDEDQGDEDCCFSPNITKDGLLLVCQNCGSVISEEKILMDESLSLGVRICENGDPVNHSKQRNIPYHIACERANRIYLDNALCLLSVEHLHGRVIQAFQQICSKWVDFGFHTKRSRILLVACIAFVMRELKIMKNLRSFATLFRFNLSKFTRILSEMQRELSNWSQVSVLGSEYYLDRICHRISKSSIAFRRLKNCKERFLSTTTQDPNEFRIELLYLSHGIMKFIKNSLYDNGRNPDLVAGGVVLVAIGGFAGDKHPKAINCEIGFELGYTNNFAQGTAFQIIGILVNYAHKLPWLEDVNQSNIYFHLHDLIQNAELAIQRANSDAQVVSNRDGYYVANPPAFNRSVEQNDFREKQILLAHERRNNRNGPLTQEDKYQLGEDELAIEYLLECGISDQDIMQMKLSKVDLPESWIVNHDPNLPSRINDKWKVAEHDMDEIMTFLNSNNITFHTHVSENDNSEHSFFTENSNFESIETSNSDNEYNLDLKRKYLSDGFNIGPNN
ncbi:hypothetical protein HK096_009622, partial [Nowakowskiella sp. JEL0078]